MIVVRGACQMLCQRQDAAPPLEQRTEQQLEKTLLRCYLSESGQQSWTVIR